MEKVKARELIEEDLSINLEKWANSIASNKEYLGDAKIGFLHKEIFVNMSRAALLVLFSISDAQDGAIQKGFLKTD